MLLRSSSLRSVKQSRAPSLSTIPEDESCRDWTLQQIEFEKHRDISDLVQAERARLHLRPFSRRIELDCVARLHAMKMASKGQVVHSVPNVQELKRKLAANTVGENVQRGDSMFSMHYETMVGEDSINRSNILSRHFNEFGSAVVHGSDGKLYSCMLFRKDS